MTGSPIRAAFLCLFREYFMKREPMTVSFNSMFEWLKVEIAELYGKELGNYPHPVNVVARLREVSGYLSNTVIAPRVPKDPLFSTVLIDGRVYYADDTTSRSRELPQPTEWTKVYLRAWLRGRPMSLRWVTNVTSSGNIHMYVYAPLSNLVSFKEFHLREYKDLILFEVYKAITTPEARSTGTLDNEASVFFSTLEDMDYKYEEAIRINRLYRNNA